MSRRRRSSHVDTLSDHGKAMRYRIGLAFKDLRSKGYLAVQAVSWARYYGTQAPWKRLSRWLRDEASEPVRRKAVATGVVYYDSYEAQCLNHWRPCLRINYARTTLDLGSTYTGKAIDVIKFDVYEALTRHGLVVDDPEHARYETDGWCTITLGDEIKDAADAAHKFGGSDAYQSVLDPRPPRKGNKQETED